MITIGIIDNVQLLKAEKNEHGTLVLTMDIAGSAGESDNDFESLNSSSDQVNEFDSQFIIWPYKYDSYTKEPEDMLKRMKQMRAFLSHILQQYMTRDQIKFDAFAGLQLPQTDIERMQLLANEKVVAKIYDNQITQFIRMVEPHIGPKSAKLRVKFNRQSEHKAFPVLPNFAPFMESMDVPKDQSRLAYDSYDLGYRKGDPEGKPSSWSRADAKPSTDIPPPDDTTAPDPQSAKDAADILGVTQNQDLGI